MSELEQMDYNEFIQSQFEVLQDAYDVTHNNAMVWHRAKCPNPPGTLVCEMVFMMRVSTSIDALLKKAISDMAQEEGL